MGTKAKFDLSCCEAHVDMDGVLDALFDGLRAQYRLVQQAYSRFEAPPLTRSLVMGEDDKDWRERHAIFSDVRRGAEDLAQWAEAAAKTADILLYISEARRRAVQRGQDRPEFTLHVWLSGEEYTSTNVIKFEEECRG